METKKLMEYLPWKVVESPYQPENNIRFETNFTLGNGYMGIRGCMEEGFCQEMETYPGIYIAGVFDNFEEGYVELVNCPDFLTTEVWVGQSKMDMMKGKLEAYKRSLDMREGTLTREFVWTDTEGNRTNFYWQRFLSVDDVHAAAVRLRMTPLNHSLPIRIETQLNGDVFNRRQRDYPPLKRVVPNYHLDVVSLGKYEDHAAWLQTCTKTTGVTICQYSWIIPTGNEQVEQEISEKGIKQSILFKASEGQIVGFDKLVSTYTSRDSASDSLKSLAAKSVTNIVSLGYDGALKKHINVWEKFWDVADIQIEGDEASQQGIRFNIFNLIQANAYWDPYVNLPAKLLSHTRYKGNAFWDTEMFMFPFYLYTKPEAARNLMMYRYNMLQGAKDNAKRLGMRGARYPWMSAHDGSEQCDSWEYGDCEIHITADIVFAIDQYIQSTKDEEFLTDYAAEIYIETARYWVDRFAWNEAKGCFTLLAVKGPDEYCSVTNNNMYTNYLAARNLELAEETVAYMQKNYSDKWECLEQKLSFNSAEVEGWRNIRLNTYYNWDKEKNLLIQDDIFMDQPEEDLSKYKDRIMPVLEIIGYEKVMRIRILRQADVLLLMYLLNDRFDKEQKKIAYEFYDPITTHDSSLSFNTHCIMAAELGMKEKAFDYFFKTCRLDLDDEQDTARSGLHGASLGGTWQAIVNGFGGLRVINGQLSLNPILPPTWKNLSFKVHFQGRLIDVMITANDTIIKLIHGEPLEILLNLKQLEIR